jgi:hypothetical protein
LKQWLLGLEESAVKWEDAEWLGVEYPIGFFVHSAADEE